MLLTAVSEAWGQHGRGSRARQQSIGIRAFPFVRAAWRLPQALGAAQVLLSLIHISEPTGLRCT
ncbi:hypothetical protein KZ847_19305, partial [Pseudomonas aeruginosa]